MPQIAVLDHEDVLVGIREVTEGDWVTSRELRQLAIPNNHDLAQRVGNYRMDWNIGGLIPRRGLLAAYSNASVDVAKDDDLMKVLVDSVVTLYRECDKTGKIPEKLKKLARQLSAQQ